MADVNINQNKLMTFSEYNASQGVKQAPAQAQNQAPVQDNKGDTLVIAGKEITKKQAFGLAALGVTIVAALGGAFAAVKRGKLINNGKESGFADNLKEGLKSIFTAKGREKYKKLLNSGSNTNTPVKPETAPDKPSKKVSKKTADKKSKAAKPKTAKTAPKSDKPALTPKPVAKSEQDEIKAEAAKRLEKEARINAAVNRENKFIKDAYGFDESGKPVITNSAKDSLEFFLRCEDAEKQVISKASPEIQKALGREFISYLADPAIPVGWDKIAENISSLRDEFTPRELERVVKSGEQALYQLKMYLMGAYDSNKANFDDCLTFLHKQGLAKERAAKFADRIQDLPVEHRWRITGKGMGGVSEECKKAFEALKPEYLAEISDETLSIVASKAYACEHTPNRIKQLETLFTPEKIRNIENNRRLHSEFISWLRDNVLPDDKSFLNALGVSL